MSKLYILKGLPASGKTTYALELVEHGFKRVNKDSLRAMLDNSKWSKEREKNIVEIETHMVKDFLGKGYDVVVDDTNFAWVEHWREIANGFGADFECLEFNTPLMECIERDLKRENSVGAKVILRMYNQYLRKEAERDIEKADCYIFDLDGTLAKMHGRNPYDFTKVKTDVINKPVVDIYNSLSCQGFPMIVLSGRDEICRDDTIEWLRDNNIKYDALIMREQGDNRKDSIVKEELYNRYIKDYYNVLSVFDDRNQVVDMWRSIGITCMQVDYGYF